jgi:hypothetical protein
VDATTRRDPPRSTRPTRVEFRKDQYGFFSIACANSAANKKICAEK